MQALEEPRLQPAVGDRGIDTQITRSLPAPGLVGRRSSTGLDPARSRPVADAGLVAGTGQVVHAERGGEVDQAGTSRARPPEVASRGARP